MNDNNLFHVILFSFLPQTKEEVINEIKDKFSVLGENCGGIEAGILFFSAKPNLDLRKNIHFVEIAVFKDQKSFENFKEHPKHKEILELLKTSANWWVGDIKDNWPDL